MASPARQIEPVSDVAIDVFNSAYSVLFRPSLRDQTPGAARHQCFHRFLQLPPEVIVRVLYYVPCYNLLYLLRLNKNVRGLFIVSLLLLFPLTYGARISVLNTLLIMTPFVTVRNANHGH